MLDAKLLKPFPLHVNNKSFTGPLIIGTFEKRAPGTRALTLSANKVKKFIYISNLLSPLVSRISSLLFRMTNKLPNTFLPLRAGIFQIHADLHFSSNQIQTSQIC